MNEPQWNLLPCATASEDWRGYLETADAAETVGLLHGQSPEQPGVWIHHAATRAFALAASVDEARAFVEMGTGVCRWHRKGAPAGDGNTLQEGQALGEFRFRGAPDVRFTLALWQGNYLLHLSDLYPQER